MGRRWTDVLFPIRGFPLDLAKMSEVRAAPPRAGRWGDLSGQRGLVTASYRHCLTRLGDRVLTEVLLCCS